MESTMFLVHCLCYKTLGLIYYLSGGRRNWRCQGYRYWIPSTRFNIPSGKVDVQDPYLRIYSRKKVLKYSFHFDKWGQIKYKHTVSIKMVNF